MKSRILLTTAVILMAGLRSVFGQIAVVPTPSGPTIVCGNASGIFDCPLCKPPLAPAGTKMIGWQEGNYTDMGDIPINFTGPDQSTNGPDHTFVVSNEYIIPASPSPVTTYAYSVPAVGEKAFRAIYSTDGGSTRKYSWPVKIVADNRSSVAGVLSSSTGNTTFLDTNATGQLILTGSLGGVSFTPTITPVNGNYNFNISKTTSFTATVKNKVCPAATSNTILVEVYKTGVLSGPASAAEDIRVELSLSEVYKSVVRWEYSTDGGTTWVNFDYGSFGHTVTGDVFADTHKITKTTKFRVKVDRGAYGQAYTNTIEVAYVPYTDAFPVLINGANYVRQQQVTVSGITNPNDVAALPATQKHEAFTYLDGNGRTVQQNMRKASPSQNDVISMVYNNTEGARTTQYLPYVSATNDGTYRLNAFTEQAAFYANGTADKIADSAYPMAQSAFEKSPLDRVIEQGSVGQEFQLGGGHTKMVLYANNVAGNVRLLASDGSSTSFYNANDLSLTQGTDEDQKKTQTFTDKAGHTILTRVQLDATNWLETYYIYNHAGAIKYILSPKGVAALKTASWVMTQPLLDQYANQFVYDVRGRLAQKKVPGQAWMYYCYDRFDRLVLMQDANTRSANKWIFIKYDRRGRPVMQGLYTNTTYTTQATVQVNVIDPLYALDTDLYYEARGIALQGYTNQSFPTTGTELQSVNYYDNYDFDNNGTDDKAYISQGLANENIPVTTVWGLPTGSKRLVLDGGTTWLYTYMFYDADGHTIQTISNNHLAPATDNIVTAVYDFEGKVTLTKNYHNAGAGKQTTIINKFTYDASGRLLQVKQNNNNASTDQLLAQYEYNEMGQLVDKKLHNTSGTNFLQSIDYRYDIQGRLISLNNAQLTSDGILNDEVGDYFGMEYLYQTTQTGLTTSTDALYNGNISAVKWKAVGSDSGATDQKGYKYAYDKANRLTGATFKQSTTATAWGKEANVLNESVTYDLNGNIITLSRNQRKNVSLFTYGAEAIDALTYTFNGTIGDQLLKVTDAAAGTKAAGFDNGTSGTANDYTYDLHGNLLSDKNKGISSIVYNHLGKPTTIIFSDGRHVDYTYDAAATKLTMKAYAPGGTLQTTTDYVNSFVYENSVLSFFSSPEGRVVNNAGTLEYQYAIADQQGNTRVLFTSAAPAPLAPVATFEGDANDGASQYLNAAANIVSFTTANHTSGGSKVVRMNQTYKLGPAQSLSVLPGDKVDMEVWEYHEGSSGYGTTSTAVATMITNVAAIFGGVSGGVGEAGLKYTGVSSAVGTFGTGGNQGDSRPAAYLNYILFDKNYNVLDAGWQLAPATTFTKQKLSLNTLTIKEPGYVYVYLSYDDDSNNWVYFDDFKVTHTKTSIIQYNEYYPYGLQANTSWTRDNNKNNFLYNEGSEINTTTGWYDLPYRNYDAALGRFMQIDPLATQYASLSPYHYSYNNPVMFNDPSGAGYNDYPDWYNPGGMYGSPTDPNNLTGCKYCNNAPTSGSTLDRLYDDTFNGAYKWYAGVQAEEDMLQAARNGDSDALRAYVNSHGGGKPGFTGTQWITPFFSIAFNNGVATQLTTYSYYEGEGYDLVGVISNYDLQQQNNGEGPSWYFMSRNNGAAHGLAYDMDNNIIYEVNHPQNRNGLLHWLEGVVFNSVPTNGIRLDQTKSVAYQWNLNDKNQRADFWAREKGSNFLLAPVAVTNPTAATAWFQSQQGQAWNYNFFTNNCAHYAVQGMNAGGAGVNFIGPRPSSFPAAFTMSWSAGQAYPVSIGK